MKSHYDYMKERLTLAMEALEEIKNRPAYSNGADIIAGAALIKIEECVDSKESECDK